MSEILSISPLGAAPWVIPTVAQWFEEEWAPHYGPGGPGEAFVDVLQQHEVEKRLKRLVIRRNNVVAACRDPVLPGNWRGGIGDAGEHVVDIAVLGSEHPAHLAQLFLALIGAVAVVLIARLISRRFLTAG